MIVQGGRLVHPWMGCPRTQRRPRCWPVPRLGRGACLPVAMLSGWGYTKPMLSTCDSLGLLEPPVSMELCHLHFWWLEWSKPGTRGCLPEVPSKASGHLRILWRFSLTTNLLLSAFLRFRNRDFPSLPPGETVWYRQTCVRPDRSHVVNGLSHVQLSSR